MGTDKLHNRHPGVIAVVDYGMGNLASVVQACHAASLDARLATRYQEIDQADAVILPGVGAFGDAMESLNRLDLVGIIKEIAASGKPLVGICLGMQLLMSESSEFGHNIGLGIIDGCVKKLEPDAIEGRVLKVPQVGWNRIHFEDSGVCSISDNKTSMNSRCPLLSGIPNGEYMYFVHSYYGSPYDPHAIITTTEYGSQKFCSGINVENVFGFQFHPERSGPAGLRLYHNLAKSIGNSSRECQYG